MVETTPPHTRPAGMTPTQRQLLTWAVFVVVVALAAIVGYTAGDRRSNLTVRTGTPNSTPFQIGLTSHGQVYDVPLTVLWFSANGTVNDGSRPGCLAPGATAPVRFGTVKWTYRSVGMTTVVWVQC